MPRPDWWYCALLPDWWYCALLADENVLPPSGVGLKQAGRPQPGYLSALMMRG
jgi:hypothetical protein